MPDANSSVGVTLNRQTDRSLLSQPTTVDVAFANHCELILILRRAIRGQALKAEFRPSFSLIIRSLLNSGPLSLVFRPLPWLG